MSLRECGTYVRQGGGRVRFHNDAADADTDFEIDAQGVPRKPGAVHGYDAYA